MFFSCLVFSYFIQCLRYLMQLITRDVNIAFDGVDSEWYDCQCNLCLERFMWSKIVSFRVTFSACSFYFNSLIIDFIRSLILCLFNFLTRVRFDSSRCDCQATLTFHRQRLSNAPNDILRLFFWNCSVAVRYIYRCLAYFDRSAVVRSK